MLYYDPTESRVGTLLDENVIRAGEALEGLEEMTGGDILITSMVIPGGSVLRPPGKLFLEKACKSAFLIQRKSGGDMLNSIPHLTQDILSRMLKWPSKPVLAYSGWFTQSDKDNVIHNGHETGWGWRAFQGVLDVWQLRGNGLIHHEYTDYELGKWMLNANKNLKKMENSEIFTRHTVDVSHLRHDERQWRAVLEGFPDVGSTKSAQIADYCGDLAHALWWISSRNHGGLQGIGKPTKEKWHKFLGLQEGQILAVVNEDDGSYLAQLLEKEKELA